MGVSDTIVSWPTFTARLEGTLDCASQVIDGAFEMTNGQRPDLHWEL